MTENVGNVGMYADNQVTFCAEKLFFWIVFLKISNKKVKSYKKL